jgi:hypothetical protein
MAVDSVTECSGPGVGGREKVIDWHKRQPCEPGDANAPDC